MSTYVGGTYSIGLVLSGTPQNPVTIGQYGVIAVGSAATAYNGDAIYGNSITAWTVSNFGIVSAAAAAATGIDLFAGGTVTNAAGALVTGAANGVRLAGSAGLVTNAGVITGTSGAGVDLVAGGRISNSQNAVIAGGFDGISLSGTAGTVGNSGVIAGLATTGDGIFLEATGANANNAANALIYGGFDGIALVSTGGTVTNSGLVRGTAGAGVALLGTAGDVSNFGTIQGIAAGAVGVFLEAGAATGRVSNASHGLILGPLAGVDLSGAAGTVNNSGTIAGLAYGILMTSSASSTVSNLGLIAGVGTIGTVDGIHMTSGMVVNGATNATSATIGGESYGVVMAGSATSAVTNFGTIAGFGLDGVTMNAGTVVNGATNATAALIYGGFHGIFTGGSAGNVTNFGTLQGTAGAGVAMLGTAGDVNNFGTIRGIGAGAIGVLLGAGGAAGRVSNAPHGLILGPLTGVALSGAAGTVNNSGTIAGLTYGILMASSVAGTVSNLGLVAAIGTVGIVDGIHMTSGMVVNGATDATSAAIGGYRYGVVIAGTAASTVSNFGTIAGYGLDGITMSAGSVVNGATNATAALIYGGVNAIFISGSTGNVTNFGTLQGTGTRSSGIYLATGGTFANEKNALASGHTDGAAIGRNGGTVTNFGTIGGTASSGGVYLTAGGTVVNNSGGLISGTVDGATIGNLAGTSGGGGTVSNSGVIQGVGTASAGVYLTAGGTVVNNLGGLISGTVDGATIGNLAGTSGGGGTVSNSGVIQGVGTASAGVYLTAGGTVVNNPGGVVTGILNGAAIGNRSGTSGGGGTISNSGTIAGTGSKSAGILFTTGGTVVNGSGGLITGTNEGVAIESGSGTVANLGAIAGEGSSSVGVWLLAGGNVTNHLSGIIEGSFQGILISSAAGSVVNYGGVTATAAGGVGVDLSSGTVTNFGTVTAGTNGTGVYLHSGDVTNFGTIIAPGASGKAVVVRYGTFFNYGVIAGSVYGIKVSPGTSGTRGTVNVAGSVSSVSGVTGIYVVPSATIGQTVTVSGTVRSTLGTGGMAVSLGGGSNRLVLQPGAAFVGKVDGGGGASVLQIEPASGLGAGAAGLALAAAAGATYVSLGDFTNFSVLQIDPTMVAESAGALSFTTLVNQGQVNVLSGDALTFGTVAGAASVGVIDLGTAASVRFGGPVASQSVLFNPAGGTAFLDHPEQFSGTVTSFAGLDTLDLDNGKASFVGYANGQLSLSYGGSIIKLAVATPYAAPQFVFGGDGGIGTDITVHDTIITGGIVLSAPASPNPYAIASGIYVTNTGASHGGDAVYGTPGTAWTLNNAGVIKASAGGGIGVALPGGGTVINSGTITGSGGTAVRFGGSADRLVVGPGAAFIGSAGAAGIVDGGGGADEADFTVAGTDSLAGFQGFETIALANSGANVLVMLSSNFTGVTGNKITVVGGSAGNTIRAASLPATDSVVIDGGAGSDVFVFSPTSLTASDVVAGVGGSDQLVLTSSGMLNVSGVRAVELYQLASTGANSLTLANANFVIVTGEAITVLGGSAGNTIDASGVSAPNRVVLVGGAGADHFAGGAGNDTFKFTAASLTAADTVAGGGGNDTLSLTTSGTLDVGGVNGVETYALASTGANDLTLADGNFAGVSGNKITVSGGGAGNTINAAALSPSNSVVLDGGAGSDVFVFSAASLTASDTVAGVGGSDTLMLTTGGTLNVSGVRAVETFTLASTAANSLTLANGNFTNVTASTITINGGGAGNTIDAAAVTGANRIVVHAGSGLDALTGGAGNDVFFAGGQTTMTGGGGANQFTFAAAGNNAIADFATVASNRIACSNAGFALGLGGASATPQALPTMLIGSLTTGAFTAPTQRFAYNQSTGQLLYDAGGSATPAATHLVATLTGDPALTAPHLFFTA